MPDDFAESAIDLLGQHLLRISVPQQINEILQYCLIIVIKVVAELV